MARQNQETITTFGEVLHSSNISYSQNRSSSNDNRLMIYFQGMKLYIPGLVAVVTLSFKLDPYNGDYVFIFCNRKRDSIKVLRYDQNGFILQPKVTG